MPTSVAMPPMSAAYAMPSITVTPSRPSALPVTPRSLAAARTDSPIGMRTITVAVFEIHIERNADAIMKPSTSRRGCPPTLCTIQSAMRLCTCDAWRPSASRKPPRKRKIVERP